MAPQRVERSGSGCCRLYSDGCCSLPAPLGPEGQGGFRFPPFDPLDSHNPLKTTRGKPLDPCGAYGQNITRCCKPNLRSQIFRARQKTRPLLRNPAKPPLCKGRWPSAARSEGLYAADKTGLDEMTILYPAYNPSVSLTADSSPYTGEPRLGAGEPRKSTHAADKRATLGAQGNSPPGLGTDQRAR